MDKHTVMSFAKDIQFTRIKADSIDTTPIPDKVTKASFQKVSIPTATKDPRDLGFTV